MEEVKEYIKLEIKQKLKNFKLVEGGKQRTVGDIVEQKIVNIINSASKNFYVGKKKKMGAMSTADTIFSDDSILYNFDVKTHNIDSEFSMPNLIAIEKVKKIINSEKEELLYVFVDYKIVKSMVQIVDIKIFFIWELDPQILNVANLGKGQFQIKNANKEIIFTDKGKQLWFDEMKKHVRTFLSERIEKIKKQLLEWE